MIRALLLSGVSLGCVTAAYAADLPAQGAPPVAPSPVFTWTGIYGGGNVGIATSDGEPVLTDSNDAAARARFGSGAVPSYIEVRQSGVTAGGQIGYNYEIPTTTFGASGIVIGVEADAAYTNLDHTAQFAALVPFVNNYHQALDYLGTVRGRAGVAFDRFFVYGTGGFAYGESDYSHTIFGAGNAVLSSGGRSGMQTGYAAGGGFEYALAAGSMFNLLNTSAVTIGAEFLHFDLGTRSVNIGGRNASFTYTDAFKTDGDVVRARLNYKFDFSPAPVVARY